MLKKILMSNMVLYISSLDPLANASASLPANNAALATIYDRHGQTYNATQSTGANQATFSTSISEFGGKPGIHFDTTNDYYATTLNINSTNYAGLTIFACYVPRSGSGGALISNESGGGRYIFLDGIGGASVCRGSTAPLSVPSMGTLNTKIIATVQYNVGVASGSLVRVNGSQVTTFTEGSGAAGTNAMLIGRLNLTLNNYYVPADVLALLVYKSACTTAQMSAIENYLSKLSS